MKRILQLPLFIIIISFLFQGCKDEVNFPPTVMDSVPASQLSSRMAVEWMQLTYEIIKFQDILAPICSRFYGYCGITIYEAVYRGIPGHKSLGGQLKEMPEMPKPSEEVYDWLSVMIGAINLVAKSTLHEPHNHSIGLIDELYNRHVQERVENIDAATVARSLSYGEQIGNAIIEWSNSDNFYLGHNTPYTAPSRIENPSFWEPTAPGEFFIEPYLGNNRPFCLPKPDACFVPLGIEFDTVPGTFFYLDGLEVLEKSRNLTQDERNIALFWQDKTGTGQPPGHWMSIASNMAIRFDLTLDTAVKLYALMGAAMRDAFISAWESKMRTNLLRPQTYIRDYLGEPNWNTFIPTPPWPDYTSGHSVGSGAASLILTHVLGDNISFVDSTHDNQPGLRNRTFNSFYHAAEESSWSRLYGGIHYRRAIEHGVQQGRLVALHVLNTMRFE